MIDKTLSVKQLKNACMSLGIATIITCQDHASISVELLVIYIKGTTNTIPTILKADDIGGISIVLVGVCNQINCKPTDIYIDITDSVLAYNDVYFHFPALLTLVDKRLYVTWLLS